MQSYIIAEKTFVVRPGEGGNIFFENTVIKFIGPGGGGEGIFFENTVIKFSWFK